ncbi:MAG: adenylyl-sulfate kinase [Fibromonadaceae bacterium]|jgi:adenylylsulfate kinase-like enzyme/SAM-dependent methyltransferase|nr:adenylyl-sulfate kinase [Fibromonadaceae bacterium]
MSVYWITGLSGAGKTSVGEVLVDILRKENDNVMFLDGDILREVFGNSFGYSNEERKKLAFIYARLCKMLAEQGATVVCCTIAMFDAVREWNSANIRNYMEIYLKVPFSVLKARNKKGLYSEIEKEPDFEEPKKAHLTINGDGIFSPSEIAKQIVSFSRKTLDEQVYWNNYYKNKLAKEYPSQFALDILPKLEKGNFLADLGCGNGRDSLFFAKNGLNVTAIDRSEQAIYNMSPSLQNTEFMCGNFIDSEELYSKRFDYFYSRFTIHSIFANEQHKMLQNIFSALKANGLFFIEARSVKDCIFGKGTFIERNGYVYNGHFRRFIVLDELLKDLENIGFVIESSQEQNDLAKFESEDPIVIRIIARKMK